METQKEIAPIRINAMAIDGAIYIVESVPSDKAKETAYDKVKRLISNNEKNLDKT